MIRGQLTREGSLPHRQLRNIRIIGSSVSNGSLPHRQLRKERIDTVIRVPLFTAAQAA